MNLQLESSSSGDFFAKLLSDAGMKVECLPNFECLEPPLAAYLDRPPTLGEFARITGYSPRTIQRRLAEAGTSYTSSIDQLRLETACNLMQKPDMSLMDVAVSIGYEDAGHFCRAFKRWTGVSPSVYRQARGSGRA